MLLVNGKNIGCQIFEPSVILNPEKIDLDEYVRIDSFTKLEGGLGIHIGKYNHISSYASILGGGSCSIGKYSGLAQGAKIITAVGHPFEKYFEDKVPEMHPYFQKVYGHVEIGDYCLIGTNAIILPNVTIGNFSVVAAGAIVERDVPDFSLAIGNPVKIIKGRYL